MIIGGGHNGLVCAATLARRGRSVLLLEAAPAVGGAAVTREFAPGFRVSAGAHLLHLMPAQLLRDLGLEAHGLEWAAQGMSTTALLPDGAFLNVSEAAAGQRLSAADSQAYLTVYGAHAPFRRGSGTDIRACAAAFGNERLGRPHGAALDGLADTQAGTSRHA